jgi:hypothetical protein
MGFLGIYSAKPCCRPMGIPAQQLFAGVVSLRALLHREEAQIGHNFPGMVRGQGEFIKKAGLRFINLQKTYTVFDVNVLR